MVRAPRLTGGDGPPPGTVRRRVVVHGRVQGVGFRASCIRRALDAGVGGWVRNTGDGSVEAVFEGPPSAVDGLVAWCGRGPPMAEVRAVDVWSEAPVGDDVFSIR
jgi:acylphosphatase